MTFDEILKSLSERDTSDRWGIGTALPYMKSVEPCLSGSGICPTKVFDGCTVEAWQKQLSEASQRLTYCDEGMSCEKSFKTSGLSVPNALAEFDHVITSTRKDRDGDILETKGAAVDARMPLLWQHIQVQPLGPFVRVGSHDEKSISGTSAILATKMGEDVVVLVEGGALRISHGFKPKSFEPLATQKGADGKEYVRGWHIKEFDIFEVSLVSIPSNQDAVITAFSRQKLHSPLVKSWAKHLYDARPVQSPGIGAGSRYVFNPLAERWQDTHTKQFVSALEVGMPSTNKDAEPETTEVTEQVTETTKSEPCSGSCSCGKDAGELETKAGRVLSKANAEKLGQASQLLQDVIASAKLMSDDAKDAEPSGVKSAGEVATKMMGMSEHHLDGSWEQIQHKLEMSGAAYLRAKGADVDKYSDYTPLVATFASDAIVCAWDDNERKCYRISWKQGDSGPVWDGEPAEVEIKPQVIEKMFGQEHGQMRVKGMDAKSVADTEVSLPQLARMLAAKMLDSSDITEVAKAAKCVAVTAEVLNHTSLPGELADCFG